MNITPPILDDSSYDDLRKRLVNRIPVFNPEWTDHNPSDPGITLLELFAYLGEHVIHRFNQIPETTYIEYLNLLQIPRRAAEPARALLTFSTDALPVKPINSKSAVSAGEIKFETNSVIDVWPVTGIAMVKANAPLPETGSEEYSQVELAAYALGITDTANLIGYETQEIGREADAQSIDAAASVDGMIWVAILNNSELDNSKLLKAIRDESAVLNIGFSPDQAPPNIDDINPCPGPNAEPANGAVQWQVSTEQTIDEDAPRYRIVNPVGDTTSGLREEGIVRLQIPPQVGSFTYIDEDACGAGDLPPKLDDETEQKVLFWMRAFRIDNDTFNQTRFMDVNVSDCVQRVSAQPEYLGVGNAQPDQTVYLNNTPVIAESLTLEVEDFDGWKAWREVDGFHASRDDDPDYMLDRVGGTVTFGAKYVPQIGQRIRARSYQFGGGRSGNVAVDAIDKISTVSGVKLRNPMPAYGGANDESLADSLDRIPSEIRRKDRAVTSGDFSELARATPGAGVARAETLELFRPRTRETNAAGVVSVMILPEQGAVSEEPPIPTRAQLKQVCNWLDERRLLTTEVYVIPPVYRPIAVAVGLQVKAGFSVDAVRVWVETVLRQYLSPLPPFGPNGAGWRLGRAVHSAELEAAALQVEGVEYLVGLEVATFNENTVRWVAGRVNLELDEFPWLLEITVVEGAPLEPGEAIGIPQTDGPLIPVPVVVEEC